jgi:hypothetical protein
VESGVLRAQVAVRPNNYYRQFFHAAAFGNMGTWVKHVPHARFMKLEFTTVLAVFTQPSRGDSVHSAQALRANCGYTQVLSLLQVQR